MKEPFDILYFTPEIIYAGYTDWEIRLRCAFLARYSGSDFGEKQNSSRIKLRLRYFFKK